MERKTQKSVDEVLDIAGLSISGLSIAGHTQGYIHLVVSIDGNGIIADALSAETVDGYYRNDDWTEIYKTGLSAPCNCEACAAGDDPDDWAGEAEFCAGIEESIQQGIDNIPCTEGGE
jgi:hypothetical protein